MSNLLDCFVNDWNDDSLNVKEYYGEYGTSVNESFERNFLGASVSKNGLRVSSLGNYGIVQALKCVAWNQYRRSLREASTVGRKADIFHTGDVIEARLMAVMAACGLTVTNKQDEITWHGVTGHPDGMIDGTVFDVKTSSSGNFKRYLKAPPLSYVTQLAVYAEALGASRAALLFYDKDTCNLGLKYLTQDVMVTARERAKDIVEAVLECVTVQDVYDNFQVPLPIEEVFQKKPTGLVYAPSDLYDPFPDLLYTRLTDTTGYGNERQYITGVRRPEEVDRLLR